MYCNFTAIIVQFFDWLYWYFLSGCKSLRTPSKVQFFSWLELYLTVQQYPFDPVGSAGEINEA